MVDTMVDTMVGPNVLLIQCCTPSHFHTKSLGLYHAIARHVERGTHSASMPSAARCGMPFLCQHLRCKFATAPGVRAMRVPERCRCRPGPTHVAGEQEDVAGV